MVPLPEGLHRHNRLGQRKGRCPASLHRPFKPFFWDGEWLVAPSNGLIEFKILSQPAQAIVRPSLSLKFAIRKFAMQSQKNNMADILLGEKLKTLRNIFRKPH